MKRSFLLRRASTLLGLSLAGTLGLCVAPGIALAIDSGEAMTSAEGQISNVNAGVGSIRQSVQKVLAERSPEQLIADATLLLNSKDYDRAANVLNRVIEKYPDSPTALPDALSLLGETYFRSNQLWSARRVFKRIVESASEGRFGNYAPKSISRLVDIAMRKRDPELLNEVITLLDKVPGSANNLLAYARAKALIAKGDNAAAKTALGLIDDKSEYAHQARYLAALAAVKEATPPPQPVAEGEEPPRAPPQRYAAAVDLFSKVTQLPADTEAHKQVIDAAWLAIGRLNYETDQLTQAVQAYNRIDRTSPEFGTMLYELAWTYVKLGDADRALRALEVLAIADPEGQNIADGTLLRGDLMLRAGKFDKALTTYEGFKATYDPMRERVEAFLGATSDPGFYYDKLTRREFETLEGGGLPPIALEWAKEAENGPAAFAIVDDVQECRDLLGQSTDMIQRVSAVLNSPARIRAFPELKGAEERALGLTNRISLARMTLAGGLEDVDDASLSGEAGAARQERRALEARLKKLPTSDADFGAREAEAQKQWNSVSQRVQQLELQVNSLQAIVNGLNRVLTDGGSLGIVRDPASTEAFKNGVAENQRELDLYKSQLEAMRKMVSSGRVQAGFGDQRFVEDAQVRNAYRIALGKEVALLAQGQGGGDLRAYAARIQPILGKADASDEQIAKVRAEIDAEVVKRTQQLVDDVAKEERNLVGYQVRLDELDQEARVVVGEVLMKNFGAVRDRLKTVVMRADVGITQQAWEVREDQITRVKTLQRERVREEKMLREELNEVLDDAGEAREEQSK